MRSFAKYGQRVLYFFLMVIICSFISFVCLFFICLKLDDLVSSVQGVTVSCEPKDLNVSLQIPLDSKGETSYNWTVHVSYEVGL